MVKSKRILVTGGAGFIGSHLCELLIKKEYRVTSLDNYFTGSKKNHIDGVTYIEGSTLDIQKLINFSPEIIFHLGEYSRVEQSFDDIDKVWELNTECIYKVLKFAKTNNSKIIYAGSSTKFGDIGKESSPYAFTKATNTEFIKNYCEWFNLEYAITYFYNAYGPREIETGKYATLIAKFKKLFNQQKPLPIVLPGTQQRNFTHVKDIVNGLYMVGIKGDGDGFCIGSETSYSIIEIANIFGAETVYLEERKGNRNTAELDQSKTKELGWDEKYSLEEYILNFLKEKKT